jgi:flavodoxin
MCTMFFPHMCSVSQVVVNYSSSAGPAEEVAHIIEESGGEAITIGADISKPAEVDRSAKHWLLLLELAYASYISQLSVASTWAG